MKKRTYHILFLLLLIIGLAGCHADDTCRKSRIVDVGVGFYLDTINHLNNKLVVQKLTVDSIWVHGVEVDSLLYSNRKNLQNIKLQLNIFAEESKFRFVFNEDVDTLTIRYKNTNHFLSLECGYIRTHTIDTVFSTRNFIDSVAVVNESVNTIYVENIQIHHNK